MPHFSLLSRMRSIGSKEEVCISLFFLLQNVYQIMFKTNILLNNGNYCIYLNNLYYYKQM